jgi:hypothetical protein
MLINSPNISGSLTVTGNATISGSLNVAGGISAAITGSATSASYVEYSNVANKPTLVSGSSQVTYSGLTGVPSGIVSGSSQITYSGISSIPSGIVSSSAQIVGYNIFATTGSNQFNGSQAITGSLTVTGQVVAQTLNVQQVTSSIVYSSGSNIFGNSSGNTQQLTGSVGVTGSLTVAGAATFNLGSGEMRLNRTGTSEFLKLNTYYLLSDGNDQLLGSVTGATSIYAGNGVSPRLTITSGGNVGIGTTSPATKLDVVGTVRAGVNTSYYADHSYLGINYNLASAEVADNIDFKISGGGTFTTGGNFRFFTQPGGATPIERMRITSGGNMLLQSDKAIGLNTSDGSDTGYLAIAGASGDGANRGGHIYLSGNERVVDAGNVVIAAGNISSGTGTPGAIIFRTGNSVERMQITPGGTAQVGGWGTGTDVSLRINGNSNGQVAFFNHNGQLYVPFLDTSTGTDLVLTSGGYINKKSSSIRYKENIESIDIGLDFIMSLNPVKFDMKSDGLAQVGFIAEEFPDERLVSFSQIDIEDASKGLQRESINYAQITAPLVKAIQEQQSQIEILKSKIEILEQS